MGRREGEGEKEKIVVRGQLAKRRDEPEEGNFVRDFSPLNEALAHSDAASGL